MFKFCAVLALLVAVVSAAPEPKAKPQFLTTGAYSAPLLANPAVAYSAPLTAGYVAPSVYSAGYAAYNPYAAAAAAPLVYV